MAVHGKDALALHPVLTFWILQTAQKLAAVPGKIVVANQPLALIFQIPKDAPHKLDVHGKRFA
jgi:hypothetical protein